MEHTLAVYGSVMALLFSGNIFFLKRLIDRFDVMERSFRKIEIDVAIVRAQCPNVNAAHCAKGD